GPARPTATSGPAEPSRPTFSEEDGAPLSPAVRRMVAEHGVDPAAISGTGKGGRLTKDDVARHVAARATATPAPVAYEPARAPAPVSRPPRPAAADDEVERVTMSRLRQRVAERLVQAQHAAAILTTFNEVDCSAIAEVRSRHR